jgi:hypothetical protein
MDEGSINTTCLLLWSNTKLRKKLVSRCGSRRSRWCRLLGRVTLLPRLSALALSTASTTASTTASGDIVGSSTLSAANDLSAFQLNRGLTANTRLRRLVRSRNTRLEALPKPRIIVNHLDVAALVQLITDRTGIVGVCPGLKVDEAALKVITILIGAGNEVNTVNLTKAKLLEHPLHPLPANVSEDPRDTDAVCGHGLEFCEF